MSAVYRRQGTVEWIFLAILVLLPVALIWRYASPSYFFEDDIPQFYVAHMNQAGLWSYAFAPMWGHLVPGYSLIYLLIDRVTPMNFEVALAIMVTCHAVSAVLLQRIFTLLFGRAWWTYALALAWAISIVYLPSFAWFSAGLHSIPAITAALASVHGYLCWWGTGRRGWLVWSLVAMVIGLAFYEKAWLIPLYLLAMRVLLLDPESRISDSLRSLLDEWRVWLAYAAICAAFVIVYLTGTYNKPAGGAAVDDVLRYLRIFWVEGFSPTAFGIRVPLALHGQEEWHRIVIVAAQVTLIGVVAWSIARRRAAWRAWVFLLVTVVANALMLSGRVSQLGPDGAGFYIRYYTEPALLLALTIPFAFAVPRPRSRIAAVEPVASFRMPGALVGATALVALVAYVGATWATANVFSNRSGGGWSSAVPEKQSGRLARLYLDTLRADIAAARGAGRRPSLLDHDVPEAVMSLLTNLDSRSGVRSTLLSSVLPVFDEHVTFNQPGRLHIVRPDGHLERTRFVPAAGGSLAEMRRAGPVRLRRAHLTHRGTGSCVVAGGRRAIVEWKLRPHLRGSDWWLRVAYRNDPARPLSVQTDPGTGWTVWGATLPPMSSPGAAIVGLEETPTGTPVNAGVRVILPRFSRLCLRSLQIGSFDPPPDPNKVVRPLRVAATNDLSRGKGGTAPGGYSWFLRRTPRPTASA